MWSRSAIAKEIPRISRVADPFRFLKQGIETRNEAFDHVSVAVPELFAVRRPKRKGVNDADRLRRYPARFGLDRDRVRKTPGAA